MALLQQMVRLRSYSAGGEEGRIARFMAEHCQAMGLTAELQALQNPAGGTPPPPQ